jgi:hypothetical protein
MPIKSPESIDYFFVKAQNKAKRKKMELAKKLENFNQSGDDFDEGEYNQEDDEDFIDKSPRGSDGTGTEVGDTVLAGVKALIKEFQDPENPYKIGGSGWRYVWSSTLYTLGNPRLRELAISELRGADAKDNLSTIGQNSTISLPSLKGKDKLEIKTKSQDVNKKSKPKNSSPSSHSVYLPDISQVSNSEMTHDPLSEAVSFLSKSKQVSLLKMLNQIENELSDKSLTRKSKGALSQASVSSSLGKKYGKVDGKNILEVSRTLQLIGAALETPQLAKYKEIVVVYNMLIIVFAIDYHMLNCVSSTNIYISMISQYACIVINIIIIFMYFS